MKVKTFHALTMQDALRAIKEELGPDAIILSSKEVREGGRLLRVFNRPVLEVMAASEQEAQPAQQTRGVVQHSVTPIQPAAVHPTSSVSVQTFKETLHGLLQPNREMGTPGGEKRPASSRPVRAVVKQDRLRHLRAAVEELNSLLGGSSREEAQPGPRQSSRPLVMFRRTLIQQGMNPTTVEFLVNEALRAAESGEIQDDQSIRRALQREIAQRVSTSGPLLNGNGRPTIGLLIGPSGAGKTSAVAKLAAYYRLEQRKSVALITFDTYRETAVEQLRRYAKAVGVPFACALSARQVHEGLRRHARVDLVLIDMPGIGPEDLALANELRRLLRKETITTHVVLPASTREQEACRITGRLRDLPQLCLLFTKLDETQSFGTIFEVAHQTGVPLSYWSIGRRVPGDIEVASSERLAGFLTLSSAIDTPGQVSQSVCSTGAMSAMTGIGTHHG